MLLSTDGSTRIPSPSNSKRLGACLIAPPLSRCNLGWLDIDQTFWKRIKSSDFNQRFKGIERSCESADVAKARVIRSTRCSLHVKCPKVPLSFEYFPALRHRHGSNVSAHCMCIDDVLEHRERNSTRRRDAIKRTIKAYTNAAQMTISRKTS